jgi:hypothetical protein
MGNHRRLPKRRGITQGAPVGDITKQPTHDSSAAGLRQFGGEEYLVRLRYRTDFFATCPLSSSIRLDDPSTPALRETKA